MTRVLTLAKAALLSIPLAFGALGAKAADIVDTAVSAGNFSTLVSLVEAAGLAPVLKGDGPFTVFAPTNEAFAALPAGTLDTLRRPENRERLVAILTYHVVPGSVPASAASGNLVQIDTVQGSPVTVDGRQDGVTVNGARVIGADVMASNGIIHVIDQVIMPPAE